MHMIYERHTDTKILGHNHAWHACWAVTCHTVFYPKCKAMTIQADASCKVGSVALHVQPHKGSLATGLSTLGACQVTYDIQKLQTSCTG